ncbi:transposase-like protein [Escherichia coli]|nr:transposase-like protein [Escherichia coli]
MAKFAEHLPLYRQSEIYARQGVELHRNTMGRWVDIMGEQLRPLYDELKHYVLMPGKVHADDTPVNVLEPGQGKTRTGRLWVYVRDDRNAGSTMPAAVWFSYSPDRKGIHPQQHLADYRGILQADAYAGYNALYESGQVTEAACMAHARRKIHDVHVRHPTTVKVILQELATAASMTENGHRRDMHPAEQIAGFRAMAQEGKTPAQIGDLLGYSPRHVQRMLKLADLAPVILDALAEDRITTEHCQALALENDTARQVQVFEAACQSGWGGKARGVPFSWSVTCAEPEKKPVRGKRPRLTNPCL